MKKRYSKYINPILLLIDLTIVNSVAFVFFRTQLIDLNFYVLMSLFWFVSSSFTGFYKVYRFTGILHLIKLLVSQLAVFILGYFAYFGIFKEGIIIDSQFNTVISIVAFVSSVKIIVYYALKEYRKRGNNLRNVVIIGDDDVSKKMTSLFKNQKGLGYHYKGFFSNKKSKQNDYLGEVNNIFNYVNDVIIHEIYISQANSERKIIKQIIKFSEEKDITIKLIPNSNELYSKNQKEQFYSNMFKVFSVKKMPFEYFENRIVKRLFDIFFSFFVIIFVMSWLIPILWILVKSESKGPLFFKQEREGVNAKKFVCYKFRSMRLNPKAHKVHATKNDSRVTKMGAFIRKTSIDELPQFFNVFLGDMSVVGPRPHMNYHTEKYTKEIENYMDRHIVKPGITGLAQVSGYRGEIKTINDIKNRVRLDIFYIENWSFLLDIKIIVQTAFNVFKGEENAY